MKKSTIYNLFLMWTILSAGIMSAQNVKGIVSDVSGPLPQVNVNIKGTLINTITDFDGKFTLNNVDPKAVLVFSFIGFLSQEVAVSGKTNLQITLKSDINTLNEVVIVGYNSQKKASITSAVATVDINDLAKTKVSDIGQALQGQIAGVFVAANTGQPGDGVQIRIRGEGTVGNNDVLYVVDGVPTRDITFLNQSDVKSMSVLKDAAAGAIYGSRASGGVVIITTKNGQLGKTKIDVDYYSGIHQATNLLNMLNADQYLTVKDQAWHNTVNDGVLNSGISPYAADKALGSVSGIPLANTNWQKELFTTGISRNLQISASGATENTQYLISAGYYDMNGIVVGDNDKYQKFNFRTNLSTNISDRFKVGTNLQISNAVQDAISSSGDAPGVIRHALLRSPVLGVYKSVTDPTYSASDPYTDLPFYTGPNDINSHNRYEYTSNPLAIVHFTNNTLTTFKNFGNVFAEYSLLSDKSLKFRSNMGVDISFTHNKNFAQNYGDNDITDTSNPYYGMGRQNRPNNLNEDRGQEMTFTFTNTLNYVKTFNEKHLVNLLLGAEKITNSSSGIGGSRTIYDNTSPAFQYLNYGGTGAVDSSGNITQPFPNSGGDASGWKLLSYFTSGTYGYDNKYFATATIRADASSRFGPNNKWGYFPSVSAGWIISKEKFMEKADWVSNLKLRASWGQSGNQEIPNDGFDALYAKDANGVHLIRLANPNEKWETTSQTDIGIDLSVLKNKLTFTTDYFSKNTTGILLPLTPPGVVGDYLPSYFNSGAVTNKGLEFAVNFKNNSHEFKYNINANIATLSNMVNKLDTNLKSIANDNQHTITIAGQPLNSYFGYVFDGIYQNTAEINKQLFSNTNNTQPGDIRFKDLNGDGKIDANDRTYIGNPNPKVTYGIAFSCSYKNFDMSLLFQGVQGVDRYNDSKQILNYDTRPFNSTTAVLDAWHGDGTSNTTPRLSFNDVGGSKVSSVFVEDASYLRLKNIEIGYTFAKEVIGINYLRLYVSGQNMLTFTKYTGLDPESTSFIDRGTYPQSKAFIFGLRVKL